MGDIQNQIEGAGIIMDGSEGNSRLIPEGLEIWRYIHTMMQRTCGLGSGMMRATGWQEDVSHDTNQEQDEQDCQGKSSKMVHHVIHAERDRDRAETAR